MKAGNIVQRSFIAPDLRPISGAEEAGPGVDVEQFLFDLPEILGKAAGGSF